MEPPLKKMAPTIQKSHHTPDRFTSLPQKIIHHMFTFLAANDTVRLRNVSRKLRKLCFSSPSLFFRAYFDSDSNSYSEFINFVHLFLVERKRQGVQLDTFVIHYISKKTSINVGISVVNTWIRLATECGVKELDVLLLVDKCEYYCLPDCLQYCDSLRVLRLNLQMGRLSPSSALRLDSLEEFVIDSVLSAERLFLARVLTWWSLKKLKLENVDRIDDITIDNSSFLEEFIISDYKGGRHMVPWKLRISSSSFKNLKISRSRFVADVEINLNCSSLKNVSVHGTRFNKNVVSRIACSALENVDVYGCCFSQVCIFDIDTPSVHHIKIGHCDFRICCEMNTNCLRLGGLTIANCELVPPENKFINRSLTPCIGIKAEELVSLAINSSDKYSYRFPLAFLASRLQKIRWTGDPVEFMLLGLDSFRSLVNASIDIKPSCRHRSEENARRCKLVHSWKFCVANLFECLSRAKTLEINMWPIEIVYMQKDEPIFRRHRLITFPNLEHLVLVADKLVPDKISAIAYFLERVPNLQTITVKCEQDLHVLSDPNLIELLGLNVEKFTTSVGQVTIARIEGGN